MVSALMGLERCRSRRAEPLALVTRGSETPRETAQTSLYHRCATASCIYCVSVSQLSFVVATRPGSDTNNHNRHRKRFSNIYDTSVAFPFVATYKSGTTAPTSMAAARSVHFLASDSNQG